MGRYTILIAGALTLSCGGYKRGSFTYSLQARQAWIDAYKYEAFYRCVKERLRNDSLRLLLQRTDLFSPEGLAFETIDDARAVGRQVVRKAPKPYVKVDEGDTDAAKKNYYSFYCLRFYASKELDSAATEAYRSARVGAIAGRKVNV